MKRLIVTGDDFGLAIPVNEAVEIAHRHGILSATSLMMAADATGDAVERARRLPSLRVGLHIVLVDGRPVLPPGRVPALVDQDGNFRCDLFFSGLRFFLKGSVRQQLEAEIRAQFQAFMETGLELDHVNGHNHMHLHPTVLGLILKVGEGYGLSAVRVPYEPPVRSWRITRNGLFSRLMIAAGLLPWTIWMRRRLQRAGVGYNDFIFGLNDSGQMREPLILELLRQLPPGVTEFYCHPASRRCALLERTMPEYENTEELAALVSPRVRDLAADIGIQSSGYRDLSGWNQ